MDKLIQAALQCGAAKAVVIPAEQVVLSESFRAICESNACGLYGRCWMCPPGVGDIHLLMDRVRSYGHGLLYQSISPLEDSYDIEGMTAAAHSHALLAQRLERSDLLPQHRMHLTCGGCRLCTRCAQQDGQPCRHPDQALTSMEACGIDVYQTTKNTPLKYINGANTVTYFGIVLF